MQNLCNLFIQHLYKTETFFFLFFTTATKPQREVSPELIRVSVEVTD